MWQVSMCSIMVGGVLVPRVYVYIVYVRRVSMWGINVGNVSV